MLLSRRILALIFSFPISFDSPVQCPVSTPKFSSYFQFSNSFFVFSLGPVKFGVQVELQVQSCGFNVLDVEVSKSRRLGVSDSRKNLVRNIFIKNSEILRKSLRSFLLRTTNKFACDKLTTKRASMPSYKVKRARYVPYSGCLHTVRSEIILKLSLLYDSPIFITFCSAFLLIHRFVCLSSSHLTASRQRKRSTH